MDLGSGGRGRVGSEVAGDVDLIATALNYRFPVYFSPLNDPMAEGTDAFLQVWDGLQAFAFPSFALIHQVIHKLRSSKGTFLTLIAPYWPQNECFPELLSLVVAPPLPLLSRRDLLRQPHFHCQLQYLPMLSLHAWRLFSGSCATYGCLNVWLTSSPSVGASHLAICTNIDGSAIGLGVLVGDIPSLL